MRGRSQNRSSNLQALVRRASWFILLLASAATVAVAAEEAEKSYRFEIGVDGRSFLYPATVFDVEVASVLNPEQVIRTQPPDEIANQMGLSRLEMELSSLRLSVGVKVLF